MRARIAAASLLDDAEITFGVLVREERRVSQSCGLRLSFWMLVVGWFGVYFGHYRSSYQRQLAEVVAGVQ